MERFLGQVRHHLQQGERHVLADDGRRLQERLVLRQQPVDARCEHRLDGRGHPDLAGRPREPVVTTIADEHARLDRRSHAFLQEERVTAGAFDQRRLKPGRGNLTSHEDIEEGVRTLRRERVEPKLRVVTLVAPGVLVLGTIAEEKQNTATRDALDQGLEHRLRLGVDPVEILEEHGDRPETTLLEKQQLHRLQRSPLLLGGIEHLPRRIVDRHVEEREDGGERWRQRTRERQHLLRHSLPDFAHVVARLDLKVRFQQVDDREIGRRLPVGGRAADQDQRVSVAVRLDEFPEET